MGEQMPQQSREIIDSVPWETPSVEPQEPKQSQEIIKSVPWDNETPKQESFTNTNEPNNRMREWGGYTGHRVGPDGHNPNVPVINPPER
jgi:hypothetical protein